MVILLQEWHRTGCTHLLRGRLHPTQNISVHSTQKLHERLDEDKGRDTHGEDEEIDEKTVVEEHGQHREDRIRQFNGFRLLAFGVEELASVVVPTMNDRLEAKHDQQHGHEVHTSKVHPILPMLRNAHAHVADILLCADRFPELRQLHILQLCHAKAIDKDTDAKHDRAFQQFVRLLIYAVDVLHDRLTDDEEHKRGEKPTFPIEEPPRSHARPHEVTQNNHQRVTYNLRVPGVGDPVQSLVEIALFVHKQVLDVIVHAALPTSENNISRSIHS